MHTNRNSSQFEDRRNWKAGTGIQAQSSQTGSKVTASNLVPGADRLGPPEGRPSAAPAYAGQTLLGWVFLNTDIAPAIGYSGKPINILIGLTRDGKIAGAR